MLEELNRIRSRKCYQALHGDCQGAIIVEFLSHESLLEQVVEVHCRRFAQVWMPNDLYHQFIVTCIEHRKHTFTLFFHHLGQLRLSILGYHVN